MQFQLRAQYFKWLTGIATLALSFASAEVALRVVALWGPEPQKSIMGEAKANSNSDRRWFGDGTSHPIALPPIHKADLLVVGDSFAFGHKIREEQTFAGHLSRSLEKTVVNLGVVGTMPAQYNRMLEVGLRYHPSQVIYTIFTNDFCCGEAELRTLNADYTFKTLEGDRRLFLESLSIKEKIHRALRFAMGGSYFLQLLRHFFAAYQASDKTFYQKNEPVWIKNQFQYLSTTEWDPMLDWNSALVRRLVARTANYVKEAKLLLDQNGSNLTVILIPNKEFAYAPLTKSPTRYLPESHRTTLREFSRQIKAMGVDFVALTAPLMAKAKEGRKLYFSIDGHLNDEGNKIVADSLYQHLRQKQNGFSGG